MAFFYSAETGGFYHDAVHDEDARPADCVPVSEEEHAALFNAQAAGLCIQPGPDGRPLAGDHPALSADEALAALRRRRDALLRDSDHTQVADYPISPELRAGWAIYRQQLRDLPETITDPTAAVWPTPPAEEGAQP